MRTATAWSTAAAPPARISTRPTAASRARRSLPAATMRVSGGPGSGKIFELIN